MYAHDLEQPEFGCITIQCQECCPWQIDRVLNRSCPGQSDEFFRCGCEPRFVLKAQICHFRQLINHIRMLPLQILQYAMAQIISQEAGIAIRRVLDPG